MWSFQLYAFFIKQHDHFVAAVRKWEMLVASKVKMNGSEEKSEQEEID